MPTITEIVVEKFATACSDSCAMGANRAARGDEALDELKREGYDMKELSRIWREINSKDFGTDEAGRLNIDLWWWRKANPGWSGLPLK